MWKTDLKPHENIVLTCQETGQEAFIAPCPDSIDSVLVGGDGTVDQERQLDSTNPLTMLDNSVNLYLGNGRLRKGRIRLSVEAPQSIKITKSNNINA